MKNRKRPTTYAPLTLAGLISELVSTADAINDLFDEAGPRRQKRLPTSSTTQVIVDRAPCVAPRRVVGVKRLRGGKVWIVTR